jgi:hypothetical protein
MKWIDKLKISQPAAIKTRPVRAVSRILRKQEAKAMAVAGVAPAFPALLPRT